MLNICSDIEIANSIALCCSVFQQKKLQAVLRIANGVLSIVVAASNAQEKQEENDW